MVILKAWRTVRNKSACFGIRWSCPHTVCNSCFSLNNGFLKLVGALLQIYPCFFLRSIKSSLSFSHCRIPVWWCENPVVASIAGALFQCLAPPLCWLQYPNAQMKNQLLSDVGWIDLHRKYPNVCQLSVLQRISLISSLMKMRSSGHMLWLSRNDLSHFYGYEMLVPQIFSCFKWYCYLKFYSTGCFLAIHQFNAVW